MLEDSSHAAFDKLSVYYRVGSCSVLHVSGRYLISWQLSVHQEIEDSAWTSSTVITATGTRVVGLGGGGVESAAACCVVEIPEPTAQPSGRVLKSPGWVRLLQSLGHLPKSPGRVRVLKSPGRLPKPPGRLL